MSVPWKYRSIGDFHRYYSGEKQAPVLTLVIGGNHEASNYFSELYYGGWLASNIYYLGAVNVLRYGPFRIAGLSGIVSSPQNRTVSDETRAFEFPLLKVQIADTSLLGTSVQICGLS